MNRYILQYTTYILGAVMALTLAACNDPDEPSHKPEICPPATAARTVLVYQVANNNLGTPTAGYDVADLDEMISAAKAGHIGEGNRLLVYRAPYRTAPFMLELSKDGVDTLKHYSSDTLSVDSRRMSQVLKDMSALAPADSYGMIFWSHGTGWIQDGMEAPDSGTKRSFGYDGGRTMNITTLASVLEDGPSFDWLYFDCCHMASVETLYELRHTAPLIVGSATELPVDGMPYQLNIKEFFRIGDADLIRAATNTFDSYNSLTGMYRTCTMSVVDTRGLDALAAATAAIYDASPVAMPEGYTAQRFEDQTQAQCRYFDFAHYVEALCVDDNGDPRFDGAIALLADFRAALDDCVLYRAATPRLWDRFDLTYHCGMSTYIIQKPSNYSYRNYNTLAWYSDVAAKLIK
ncbi:MAG: hypothetical protein K2M55_05930 [Muribaculaceae bacterium]|nr:hypothetical protein [Muribaculaceae bacterium]